MPTEGFALLSPSRPHHHAGTCSFLHKCIHAVVQDRSSYLTNRTLRQGRLQTLTNVCFLRQEQSWDGNLHIPFSVPCHPTSFWPFPRPFWPKAHPLVLCQACYQGLPTPRLSHSSLTKVKERFISVAFPSSSQRRHSELGKHRILHDFPLEQVCVPPEIQVSNQA